MSAASRRSRSMTADPDVPLEELRRSIAEAVQRAVDGLSQGYGAPLRRRLRTESEGYDAAALCLGLGRLCDEEMRTLPCAVTLGLLEEMGRVFLGLEDGESMVEGWGMPRTLNAADGLYTLGRQLLLTHEALDVESRLDALSVFVDAARAFSEALHAHAPDTQGALSKATRSLYPAAASFAALCCGLESARRDELVEAATVGSIDAALVKASVILLREP